MASEDYYASGFSQPVVVLISVRSLLTEEPPLSSTRESGLVHEQNVSGTSASSHRPALTTVQSTPQINPSTLALFCQFAGYA
ncbi:hypothetical protein E4U55_008210 [Claviceps digitariae]|nr:hypothetical protein E4U55_008210 [Claviceps digitariae]